MQYLVTAAQMKEYDNNTINVIGIPALVLMERAALAIRDEINALCMKTRVLIVAGVGNNGGDGVALARLLSEQNYMVTVCVVGDFRKATESFRTQWNILKHYSVEIIDTNYLLELNTDIYEVIVDAVFGVGLSREITGEFAEIIQKMNHMKGYKIAVDIPSGVCTDTGKILGCAFRAEKTVTFAFCKLGMMLYPGTEYAGKIMVKDIGITEKAFLSNSPEVFTYQSDIKELLPKRQKDGNKGTFGKVLVIGGFDNMVGAAILCSKAVLEMGAGMVRVICPLQNRDVILNTVPEIIYSTLEELEKALKWSDVVIIGPGLGKSMEAYETLDFLLSNTEKICVFDADALNLISDNLQLKEKMITYKGIKILTPHIGELARLLNVSIGEIKNDYINVAKNCAKEYHGIAVCKDARTLVTMNDKPIYLNISGNNGMATAGSGDVLAGILGGLCAQGMEPFEASCLGVYLHGMAGDNAKEQFTEFGLTASKIIENIAGIMGIRI